MSGFNFREYPQTVLNDSDDLIAQYEDEDLPEDLLILDSITWFWCDVTGFVKVDDASPFCGCGLGWVKMARTFK